jgi:transposase
MKVTTLGIDLAKSIFRVHGVDGRGAVVLRRQLTHKQLLPLLANLPACLVCMEARAGAHYWAREVEKVGHTVRLMSPHFVAPYARAKRTTQ